MTIFVARPIGPACVGVRLQGARYPHRLDRRTCAQRTATGLTARRLECQAAHRAWSECHESFA
jgi:hypothetical protein